MNLHHRLFLGYFNSTINFCLLHPDTDSWKRSKKNSIKYWRMYVFFSSMFIIFSLLFLTVITTFAIFHSKCVHEKISPHNTPHHPYSTNLEYFIQNITPQRVHLVRATTRVFPFFFLSLILSRLDLPLHVLSLSLSFSFSPSTYYICPSRWRACISLHARAVLSTIYPPCEALHSSHARVCCAILMTTRARERGVFRVSECIVARGMLEEEVRDEEIWRDCRLEELEWWWG